MVKLLQLFVTTLLLFIDTILLMFLSFLKSSALLFSQIHNILYNVKELLILKTDIFAFLVLLAILIHQKKINDKTTGTILFCHLGISIAVQLLLDCITWMIDGKPGYTFYILNNLFEFFYYVCSLFICFFWFLYAFYTVRGSVTVLRKKWYLCIIPLLVEFVFIIISPKYKIIYYIDENNFYHRGNYFVVSLFVHYFYTLYSFVLWIVATIKEKNKPNKRLFSGVAILQMVPIIGTILQFAFSESALQWVSYALSLLILYLLLQTRKEKEQSLYVEHIKYELLERDVSVMKKRIQPHFLYNALNVISYECEKDASKAQALLQNFSNYLRANLNSLSQDTPILFTSELEHVKDYMYIETTRFPNVKINYNIEFEDFVLPPLTLQPLVENAVKHGLYENETNGLISIHSYRENNNAIVIIEDNGLGFDPSKQDTETDAFLGLKNIEKRLQYMCKGIMTVKSVIGKGTIITLSIPMLNS